MKSRGDRTSADSTAVIPVQVKDDISRRIGWAMVHAVRSCGGKPSRQEFLLGDGDRGVGAVGQQVDVVSFHD